MATKIVKVRIGDSVYEKTVQIPDEKTKPPVPTVEDLKPKTILEKAAEAVEEVVKPKRRGRRPKKPSSSSD